MTRLAWLLLLLLSACIVDDELDVDQIDQEAAVPVTVTAIGDYDPVTISAPAGTRYFKTEVAPGTDYFNVTRSGAYHVGADVYVKRGALPTTTDYNCRRMDGTQYNCRIAMPLAGTWYIMVRAANTGYTNMTLNAYSDVDFYPIANHETEQVAGGLGQDYSYKLVVPAGMSKLAFTLAIDPDDTNGIVEMFVKRNAFAGAQSYDCDALIGWEYWAQTGGCTFTAPAAGTYYVKLHVRARYRGTFSANYSWGALVDPVVAAP